MHAQPAHGAGLGGAGFEDQAPGGVIVAGNQVFRAPATSLRVAGNCPTKPNCLTASFHSSSLAPGCIPDSTLRFHSSLRAVEQELSSIACCGQQSRLDQRRAPHIAVRHVCQRALQSLDQVAQMRVSSSSLLPM